MCWASIKGKVVFKLHFHWSSRCQKEPHSSSQLPECVVVVSETKPQIQTSLSLRTTLEHLVQDSLSVAQRAFASIPLLCSLNPLALVGWHVFTQCDCLIPAQPASGRGILFTLFACSSDFHFSFLLPLSLIIRAGRSGAQESQARRLARPPGVFLAGVWILECPELSVWSQALAEEPECDSVQLVQPRAVLGQLELCQSPALCKQEGVLILLCLSFPTSVCCQWMESTRDAV